VHFSSWISPVPSRKSRLANAKKTLQALADRPKPYSTTGIVEQSGQLADQSSCLCEVVYSKRFIILEEPANTPVLWSFYGVVERVSTRFNMPTAIAT
jgi:hypothetical protein